MTTPDSTAPPAELPVVQCLDCKTPVTSALARARRRGGRCWRAYRRRVRAEQTYTPLPGMTRLPGQHEQTGPDLIDHPTGEVIADADEPTV